MNILYGRPTGTIRADGTLHRQPRFIRRMACVLAGLVRGDRGHRPKFDAHPRGSCIGCGWWPAAQD
jgi:hypothetical protein